MCGCEKHHDRSAPCTCICPEHRNFERAYDLAMSRYDEIVTLRARVAAAEQRITEDWPTDCTCGHEPHLHDAEADPVLCMSCGDNTRCNYADPEEIAADRWEEGHSAGVIDYQRRYVPDLTPGERVLRAVEMVECWDDNPYRAALARPTDEATP